MCSILKARMRSFHNSTTNALKIQAIRTLWIDAKNNSTSIKFFTWTLQSEQPPNFQKKSCSTHTMYSEIESPPKNDNNGSNWTTYSVIWVSPDAKQFFQYNPFDISSQRYLSIAPIHPYPYNNLHLSHHRLVWINAITSSRILTWLSPTCFIQSTLHLLSFILQTGFVIPRSLKFAFIFFFVAYYLSPRL